MVPSLMMRVAHKSARHERNFWVVVGVQDVTIFLNNSLIHTLTHTTPHSACQLFELTHVSRHDVLPTVSVVPRVRGATPRAARA